MGWWKETIDIVKKNDPAARSSLEIILTYPGIKALAAHRLSHFLWKHSFKLIARMHSQFWRFWTQIEIHPGAEIAEGVFIDHGSGLVIGETAIVEKGVMLYHGVTLGGTGKDVGKRHPTVREGALVSAHAQVIGPIEIGKNAKVVNSLITGGAKVEGTVINSVIGSKVTIEEGAIVKDSVIFSNTIIKKGAVINYSIIDEDVTIGENAIIGEEKNENVKIAVVGRDVVVDAEATIPAGANIEHNVRKEQ